jgi:hypothetical protein
MKHLLLILSLIVSASAFAGKDCEDAVLLTTLNVQKAYVMCNDVKDFCFNDVLMTTSPVKSAQICKNVKSKDCYDMAYMTTLKPASAAAICKDVKSKCFDAMFTGDVKAAAKACRELEE